MRWQAPASADRHLFSPQEAYAAKYGEEINTGLFYVYVYEVRLVVAFTTLSDAEAFPTTATRWQFAGTADSSSSGPVEGA